MKRWISLSEHIPSGLRATLCYATAMVWAKALSMLSVPILTRILTPAEFGRLELLSSAIEFGSMIAGAGLVDTLFRFATSPNEDGRRAGARITGLALLIAATLILGVAVFAGRIAAAMPLPTPRIDIVLLGTAVAVESVIGVPLGWLRMNRRAGAYALLASGRVTLQVTLLVALVVTGHGVEGVLWAGCIAALAAASFLAVLQGRDTGIAIDPRASVRMLGYGLPLIGSGIASFILGTADRWLLAGTVSAAALGQYALAMKIAMIVILLTQPFEMWWYPQRLRLIHTPEGLARSSRVVGAGAAYLLCAGAMTGLASPWLVRLMAPPSYAIAQQMVPFLVASLVLQLLSSMASAGCYARKTSTVTMSINALAAAVTLGFYLLLIPRYGVSGAIEATLVGQTVRLTVIGVVSHRTVPLTWPFRRLAAVAMAASATCALPLLAGSALTGTLLGSLALMATFWLALPAIAGRTDRIALLRATIARIRLLRRTAPVPSLMVN